MSKLRSFASADPGRVTADFFTDSHRLSATVFVYKRRLIDVLSDRLSDYLNLHDVYISRNNNPGEIIATFARGTLVKRDINFVILTSEAQAVSKEKYYVPNRVTLPVFAAVPFFEITGTFQWLGDLDIKKIMATETQQFLPILNPTATSPFIPDLNFQGPTALVNKTKIQVFCIGEAPE
ncbi:MAG: hypothetical protein D6784_04900 [Chloroflexi bacterium]|nr:MAG: hypothetical protein D6784_04900 [Chloroflexota bacterium]